MLITYAVMGDPGLDFPSHSDVDSQIDSNASACQDDPVDRQGRQPPTETLVGGIATLAEEQKVGVTAVQNRTLPLWWNVFSVDCAAYGDSTVSAFPSA